ncbi:GAF domain-containing protein [Streptomyces sp. NPDC023327]|uniref:GAF domain-containing protein n=1 Tax=Streptomyces sp. NPDC023327 TaxID=3157088 RepID=UPI0033FCEFAE
MPDGADAPLPSMPLLDAVLGVGADLDLRATLQHIVDSARRLTGAAYGSLGMTAPSQEGPAELFVSGEDEGKYENKGEAKGHRTNDSHNASDSDGDSGDDVVRVPIHVHDEAFGDLLLAGKAEGPFTEEDRQLLRVLASQAGIAIGNARLFEAARQRERWIEGAAAVTTALLTGEAAADALMTVADRARILAGAAAGVILQPTESGGMRIVAASTDGPPPGRTTPTEGHPPRSPASATALTPPHRESPSGTPAQNADPTPPTPPDATPTPDQVADGDRDSNGTGTATATATGDDLIGTTIEPGSAVLTQLLGGEPVFIEDSATDPRMTTHVRARFGPSMMLPLQAGGRLIGTLALPRRRGAPAYTAAERLLATQFASQAALALVLADAQQSRQRLAVFEDRDRIARDLHDLVVQRLFATGMMLESTRRKAHSPQVESTLGHAVDELESTIQEVRTAIFALQQPPADAPTTFRGKVLRETAGAAAVLGIQPSVHFGGAVDTRITDPAAGRLLAALRRALAAASRRTGVTRVDVAVDARATLPDGREGVRLTVYDDGATDGVGAEAGTTVTWQSPLQAL